MTNPEVSNWNEKGLSWRWQVLIFLIMAGAVILRRPDAVLNPQFWAEDSIWYAQAYNFGWLRVFGFPVSGYLNTLPRLVAVAALLLPLKLAPLLGNLFGILLQVLPVSILLSSRCSAWGRIPVRTLLAAVYIALPNSGEIDVNITDAQFHLAFAALLLATGAPPRNRTWAACDVIVMCLSGLTGPWSLVLVPVLLAFYVARRYRWTIFILSILAMSAVVQMTELLGHTGLEGRMEGVLGATPLLFLRIIAGNVFAAALIGGNGFAQHGAVWSVVVVAGAGLSVLLYALFKAHLELKLFVAFSLLILAASLKSPMVAGFLPHWQVLLTASEGTRYWFFPMLAFLWSLIWCFSYTQSSFVRISSGIALLGMTVGIIRDWRYPPYKDQHFAEHARLFDAASPGTIQGLPINPEGWGITLYKKDIAVDGRPFFLFGVIDEPRGGAKVLKKSSRVLPVRGWCLSEDGMKKVSIYVDRVFGGNAKTGYSRPDLLPLFYTQATASSGWSAGIDLESVSLGIHQISVVLTANNGATKTLRVDITVLP